MGEGALPPHLDPPMFTQVTVTDYFNNNYEFLIVRFEDLFETWRITKDFQKSIVHGFIWIAPNGNNQLDRYEKIVLLSKLKLNSVLISIYNIVLQQFTKVNHNTMFTLIDTIYADIGGVVGSVMCWHITTS